MVKGGNMIEQALGVYFVDQYNFTELCERANSGDSLSRNLVRSIMGFVDQAPPPVCSRCQQLVPGPQVPTMTIVVMCTHKESLTSWICEECATCDDLEKHIEQVIRDWPAIPKNSTIDFVKKGTLH
jgi:hypothetical protein